MYSDEGPVCEHTLGWWGGQHVGGLHGGGGGVRCVGQL